MARPVIAVFGAGGLLGSTIVRIVENSDLGYDARPIFRSHPRARKNRLFEADIGDAKSVRKITVDAAVIINCAANSDVDGIEVPQGPRLISQNQNIRANGVGPLNVAEAAKEHGAYSIHISTDFVFDGAEQSSYDEFDEPRPLSAYGRTKLHGENCFRASGGDLIVRLQGLYGIGGDNFFSRMAYMLNSKTHPQLRIDRERRVQPTWVVAAAEMILTLALRREPGIFHVSCRGETTWADFAAEMCRRLHLPQTKFEAVPTSALSYKARRPANSVFSHLMLRGAGLAMPTWQDALQGYLDEYVEEERKKREGRSGSVPRGKDHKTGHVRR